MKEEFGERVSAVYKGKVISGRTCFIFLLIFKDFIYLFEREREHMSRGEEQRERGRESPTDSVLSTEPYEGLDTMTLRS